MKIEFSTRDKLVAFLNTILGIGTPFVFEVDGKKIEFFDLRKDDLSMLQTMASSYGGSVERSSWEAPSVEGLSGKAPPERLPPLDPFYWALCIHDILKKDCTTCTLDHLVRTDPLAALQLADTKHHNEWPELAPYIEALEVAAHHVAYVQNHHPTPAKVVQARALLTLAAGRYSRALHDKFMSMRFR